MSVQFGVLHFDGSPVDQQYIGKVQSVIAPYGPDGGRAYINNSIGVLYGAFETTKESHRETQPYVSASRVVTTWDGRLDNREELIGLLEGNVGDEPTDVAIVAASYERWGAHCFHRLIGDWAVSIWDPRDQTLILGKDFLGSRQLYYSLETNRVTWCSVLDPLAVCVNRAPSLNEEYIAGWLWSYPALHLTPYVGIQSVPASTCVLIRHGVPRVQNHWAFDPESITVYHDDQAYEEHFRTVFFESVRRRLRSDTPVLAELSGGMDSSSIVCVGDLLMAQGRSPARRLDTISYYDDQEASWNEFPFFTIVEQRRERAGFHLDVGRNGGLASLDCKNMIAVPGYDQRGIEVEKERVVCFKSNGNRILLSGVGGDEFMGGVPSPVPELADLLTAGRLGQFGSQLKKWSLVKKRSAVHLLKETLAMASPWQALPVSHNNEMPRWLRREFINRNRAAFTADRRNFRPWRMRPSFQSGLMTLDVLRAQIGTPCLPWLGIYDTTYPYLDRDLVAFSLSSPCDQLLRPGQRRSLMRRALKCIVPSEILNRKRKAFVSRRPLVCIASEWKAIEALIKNSRLADLGFVDIASYYEGFAEASKGVSRDLLFLLRALKLEVWLNNILECGFATPKSDEMLIHRSRTLSDAVTGASRLKEIHLS